MPPFPTKRMLGIDFFVGTAAEAIAHITKYGGLIVAPAAPSFIALHPRLSETRSSLPRLIQQRVACAKRDNIANSARRKGPGIADPSSVLRRASRRTKRLPRKNVDGE